MRGERGEKVLGEKPQRRRTWSSVSAGKVEKGMIVFRTKGGRKHAPPMGLKKKDFTASGGGKKGGGLSLEGGGGERAVLADWEKGGETAKGAKKKEPVAPKGKKRRGGRGLYLTPRMVDRGEGRRATSAGPEKKKEEIYWYSG